ncbi:hypothetical protein F8568_023320 [Actinomadura sp. LD22]|uniref:Twin-arginine translocation signal domain-containing protein n=1 Tax=Actinomadura physcomitrii TaxID=2650748 RepID=A0A6I4MGG7_9ACTN|nr:hypothetical protein [Actinomadura physcomitrii]MWA03254.1 hypothetical protein [Actinomadura physcomitrii]
MKRSDNRAGIGPAVNRRGFLGAAAAIPLITAAAPTASAASRRSTAADPDLRGLAAPGHEEQPTRMTDFLERKDR